MTGARSTEPLPPTGWLARALVTADYHLRDVERQAEGFLTNLFPGGWQGWAFARVDSGGVAVDVYQAAETPKAIAALGRAGFCAIRIHDHQPTRPISCACVQHEVSP